MSAIIVSQSFHRHYFLRLYSALQYVFFSIVLNPKYLSLNMHRLGIIVVGS